MKRIIAAALLALPLATIAASVKPAAAETIRQERREIRREEARRAEYRREEARRAEIRHEQARRAEIRREEARRAELRREHGRRAYVNGHWVYIR